MCVKVADDYRTQGEFEKARQQLELSPIGLATFQARARALNLPMDVYKQKPTEAEIQALEMPNGLQKVDYWRNHIGHANFDDAPQKARAIVESSPVIRAMFEARMQAVREEAEGKQAAEKQRLQSELDKIPVAEIEKDIVDEFNKISRGGTAAEFVEKATEIFSKHNWKVKKFGSILFVWRPRTEDPSAAPDMLVFPNLFLDPTMYNTMDNQRLFEIQQNKLPNSPRRIVVPAQVALIQNRGHLPDFDSFITKTMERTEVPFRNFFDLKSQGLVKV